MSSPSGRGGARKAVRRVGDWAEVLDPRSGKHYYVNSSTGQRTWEQPDVFKQQDGGGAAQTAELRAPTPQASTTSWTKVKDARGRVYYVNKATRKTQWECPPELRAAKGARAAAWYSLVDPRSGRTYYIHRRTRETRWRIPEGDSAVPASSKSEARPALGKSPNTAELEAAKAWRVCADPKTQRPYYVNMVTKERTWQRPAALVKAVAAKDYGPAGREEEGKGGWVERYDSRRKRPYYVSTRTRRATWTTPQLASLVKGAGGAGQGQGAVPPSNGSHSAAPCPSTAPAAAAAAPVPTPAPAPTPASAPAPAPTPASAPAPPASAPAPVPKPRASPETSAPSAAPQPAPEPAPGAGEGRSKSPAPDPSQREEHGETAAAAGKEGSEAGGQGQARAGASTVRYSEEDEAGLKSGALVRVGPFAFPHPSTLPPPPSTSKQSVFVFPSAERGNQFVPTLPLDEAGDVLAVPGDHIGPGLVQQQPAASTAGHGVDTRA